MLTNLSERMVETHAAVNRDIEHTKRNGAVLAETVKHLIDRLDTLAKREEENDVTGKVEVLDDRLTRVERILDTSSNRRWETWLAVGGAGLAMAVSILLFALERLLP